MAPDKKFVLNIERPQNPFIPTDEPDWEASRATTKRSPALNYDHGKDQKSHDVSSVSDWGNPVPLENNLGLLREEVELRGGGSRRSSQSPAVSKSPNVARKTAPPVPKKPALLSSPHASQEGKINDRESMSRSITGGQSFFNVEAKRNFPPTPPPGRNRQQGKDGRRAIGSDEPPSSPRDIGTIVPVSNALMDDEIEGANTIPSLQPVRRRQ